MIVNTSQIDTNMTRHSILSPFACFCPPFEIERDERIATLFTYTPDGISLKILVVDQKNEQIIQHMKENSNILSSAKSSNKKIIPKVYHTLKKPASLQHDIIPTKISHGAENKQKCRFFPVKRVITYQKTNWNLSERAKLDLI